MLKILVINVGSTSTKIALYEEEKEVWSESADHNAEELVAYDKAYDQYDMRKQTIKELLARHNCNLRELSAVVTRAGLYPKPVKAGAYNINEDMLNDLWYQPAVYHPGNLATFYVKEISEKYNIPGLVYDSAADDELLEEVKITGVPEIIRVGKSHTLNMREVAMSYCEQNKLDYEKNTFIIAHMGGGTTLDLHVNGKVVDNISDDFGPFSPTRMGAVPGYELVKLAYSGQYSKDKLLKKLQRESGLFGYFGTTDLREIEQMAKEGNKKAQLVLEAMCINIAKGIGSLSVVAKGKIDRIILTGGMAHSQFVTDKRVSRVAFIAQVVIIPGENEMYALANGALRAICGRNILEYVSK